MTDKINRAISQGYTIEDGMVYAGPFADPQWLIGHESLLVPMSPAAQAFTGQVMDHANMLQMAAQQIQMALSNFQFQPGMIHAEASAMGRLAQIHQQRLEAERLELERQRTAPSSPIFDELAAQYQL
jgi:hypothetical protein